MSKLGARHFLSCRRRRTDGWRGVLPFRVIHKLHPQNVQIFLPPPSISTFGTGLYYWIQATTLTTSTFPRRPEARTSFIDGPFLRFRCSVCCWQLIDVFCVCHMSYGTLILLDILWNTPRVKETRQTLLIGCPIHNPSVRSPNLISFLCLWHRKQGCCWGANMCRLRLFFKFPIFCINPFPMCWAAGLAGWIGIVHTDLK